MADPKKNGGLIGNCFEPDKNGMVEYNKIAETVLCMSCFREATTSRDRRPYDAADREYEFAMQSLRTQSSAY